MITLLKLITSNIYTRNDVIYIHERTIVDISVDSIVVLEDDTIDIPLQVGNVILYAK